MLTIALLLIIPFITHLLNAFNTIIFSCLIGKSLYKLSFKSSLGQRPSFPRNAYRDYYKFLTNKVTLVIDLEPTFIDCTMPIFLYQLDQLYVNTPCQIKVGDDGIGFF